MPTKPVSGDPTPILPVGPADSRSQVGGDGVSGNWRTQHNRQRDPCEGPPGPFGDPDQAARYKNTPCVY